MILLVLDTNVLVSGLLSARNPPGQIVDGMRAGRLKLVVDDRILYEYRTVLRRPAFDRFIMPHEREWIISFIEFESIQITATSSIASMPDPDDTCFLEIAATASVPLVTGNLKHFPKEICQGVQVYSPAIFIQQLIRP